MKQKVVDGISRLVLLGTKGRPEGLKSERRLNGTNPKSELYRMGSKRRLTSRFERIENVKNFDVEKWYSF